MRVNINTTIRIDQMQKFLILDQASEKKRSQILEDILDKHFSSMFNKQGKLKRGVKV